MNDEALKSVFQRAAEISKAVPDALQEAAFNRAVEALLGKAFGKPDAKAATGAVTPTLKTEPERSVDYLLQNLDRTAYPHVGDSPRVLERALHVLRIAHKDFSIDGLGATDLARVLTEKFRLRATRQAISQALDAARNYVDRTTIGGRTSYRIMDAGERHLDSDEAPANHVTKRPGRKKAGKRAPELSATGESSVNVNSAPKKRSSGRPGPRAALNQLLNEGYFDSGHRISEIQDYLQQAKALSYKTTDLSPTLVRMLRDDMLDRNRAEDGHYEYKRK